MSHRTRTTVMTIAAVAGLAAGLAVPTASASPITDFINSIGTGSAAPGAGGPATTEIRFATSSSTSPQGYVVSRGSSVEDSCFTIKDRFIPRPVNTGFVVAPFTNNTWTVDVDTTKAGCATPLETTVGFSNSRDGNPALRIRLYDRAIAVSCADQSGSNRGCEQTDRRPDGFDFTIR